MAEHRQPAAGRVGVFGTRWSIGRYLGVDVGIDASWLFLALLISWSLATSVFPANHPDLGPAVHWMMGIIGAIGLFVSIIVHELGHALVARREGVPTRQITLFIFGGVAQMDAHPPSARAEFRVAIAGPVVSAGVAILAFGLAAAAANVAPESATGVLGYLATINLLLAAFNLLPAFPLDGGRVLRAFLWHRRDNLRWATRITAEIGGGFGLTLIVLGVLGIISGGLVAGLWWALIGLFLRNAAQASYHQLLMRRALEGESLRRFMSAEPQCVPAETTVAEFVDNYLYGGRHKMYPVLGNGAPRGTISVEQIKQVPRAEWSETRVGDIAAPLSDEKTVSVDEDPVKVMARMRREGVSRLLVMEGDRLAGIVTLRDLLEFLAMKIELDEDG